MVKATKSLSFMGSWGMLYGHFPTFPLLFLCENVRIPGKPWQAQQINYFNLICYFYLQHKSTSFN